MASEEEKRRKREQDAKDNAAMRKHAQEKRDSRRQRAHDSAAAEEQEQLNSDDRATHELWGLLEKANTMDNDELDRRVKKWRTKHGGWFFSRSLTSRDKNAIKRAKKVKKKRKGWW